MAETGDERRLEPEALEALGLERQPFDGVAPVPPDEDDETRVNLALGVLDARATPLLVSGLPGSGRTHFLTEVAASAETLAANRVDARAEDPAAALVAVSSRRGPQALLVDNAEALDGASLDALLRHARELDCGLALAVDESAAEAMARQVSEALALAEPPPVLRLPPFSEQKTRIHVDHRITAAGGSPSRLLRAADYRRIHRLSEGLPGRIDTAAAAVLRGRARGGAGALAGRGRPLLLAGGALAIAALSLTFLNPFGGDEAEDFQGPTERETVAIDISRQTAEDAEPAADDASTGAAEPADGDSQAATPEPEPPLPDVWGLPDPFAGLPAPERESPPATAETDAPGDPTASAGQPTSAASGDPGDEPAADITGGDTEAGPATPETTAAAEPDADAAATAETTSPSGDGEAGDGAAPATSADNQWFASRPAEHYTIQLLAARQMSTVERFLGRHPEIADEVRVVAGERDGATWFRLFLGDYAERQAARAALAALPEEARSAGAWTPTFGSVRDG